MLNGYNGFVGLYFHIVVLASDVIENAVDYG